MHKSNKLLKFKKLIPCIVIFTILFIVACFSLLVANSDFAKATNEDNSTTVDAVKDNDNAFRNANNNKNSESKIKLEPNAERAVAVKNDNNKTIIFYYDTLDHSAEGDVYDWESDNWRIKIYETYSSDYNYKIDNSFHNYYPLNANCCFSDAINIQNLNLFNTSNVTNMCNMFYGSYKLLSLDLSTFNTSNVTNMEGMFYDCNQLSSLNLSTFNTSNVTNMKGMFYGCYELTSLNLKNFNTSNVTNMEQMFCSSCLLSLDLSSFNTSNVVNMNGMFLNCTYLESLNLSSFNTSNVTNMDQMFENCRGLTTLDLHNFNTSSVTSMVKMFNTCGELTTLDLSNFDTSNVTNMQQMFFDCFELRSLDLSSFNTSNVTNMNGLVGYCYYLESINISSFNTSNVVDMHNMFANCTELASVDLSNFNTSKATDMSYMFSRCSSLKTLCLSNFDTSNITTMEGMFYDCSKLPSLDLSNFNTSKVANMKEMFFQCKSLMIIKVSIKSEWSCELSDNMFYCCERLVGGNGTKYDKNHTNIEYARVDGLDGKPGYFTVKEPPQTNLIFNTEGKYGKESQFLINWNDNLFNNSIDYNHDLATIGCVLSRQIDVSENAIKTDLQRNDSDNVGLGFKVVKTGNFDKELIDSPAYAIAYKIIKGNQVLISMVIRGTTSNYDKITDIKAVNDGFQSTGKNMFSAFKDAYSVISQEVSFELKSENTNIFLCGHSLGGVAVGRLAAEINHAMDRGDYDFDHNKLFLYSYAPPLYATTSVPESEHIYIHNIINDKNDWVPKVPAVMIAEDKSSTICPCFRFGEDRKFDYDLSNEKYKSKLKELYNEDNLDWIIDNKDFGAHLLTTYLACMQTGQPSISKISNCRTVSIHCPVDVYVYNADNKLCGSVVNEKVYNDALSPISVQLFNDEKFISIPEYAGYKINIHATNTGEMKFDDQIFNPNTQTMVSEKSFKNIQLTDNKKFEGIIGQSATSDTKLFVTDDEGVHIKEVHEDGSETEIKNIKYAKIASVADQKYTGQKIMPDIDISYKDTPLVKNKDYKLEYKDNIEVGTAKINVFGIGKYEGTNSTTFKIVAPIPEKHDINDAKIAHIQDQEYTGSAITPGIEASYDEKMLAEGKDYKLSYSNNIEPGTATIEVIGIGEFEGLRNVNFQIVKKAGPKPFIPGEDSTSLSSSTGDAMSYIILSLVIVCAVSAYVLICKNNKKQSK